MSDCGHAARAKTSARSGRKSRPPQNKQTAHSPEKQPQSPARCIAGGKSPAQPLGVLQKCNARKRRCLPETGRAQKRSWPGTCQAKLWKGAEHAGQDRPQLRPPHEQEIRGRAQRGVQWAQTAPAATVPVMTAAPPGLKFAFQRRWKKMTAMAGMRPAPGMAIFESLKKNAGKGQMPYGLRLLQKNMGKRSKC